MMTTNDVQHVPEGTDDVVKEFGDVNVQNTCDHEMQPG